MFTYLSTLHWLWLIPLLLACLVIQHLRTRKTRAHIAGPQALQRWQAGTMPGTAALRWFFVLAALVLVILALAGPAWDPIAETVQRQGRDVVFLVDVSKSMLAEDLRPNRLERAKADISDCVDALSGDRVALVAFAGNSAILCPLTQDYGFFRMMLSELSVDAVTRGGTNLGDAVRTVQKKVFDDQQRLGRDIILITDGEDHDSLPVEAAKAIGADGIRLLAIGIGDDQQGTLLQLPDGRGGKSILRYQGKPVRSKLDSETLRNMAAATPGGIYLPVGTNAFDLRETYLQLISAAEKHQMEEETVEHLQPKYQLFLLPAMILLALGALLPRGRRVLRASHLAALFLVGAFSLYGNDFTEGNKAFQNGDFESAVQYYEKCREKIGEDIPPTLDYNTGIAQYKLGKFPEAEALLRQAVEKNSLEAKPNPQLDNKARLALANALFHLAEDTYEQCKSSRDPAPLENALKQADECLQTYQAPTIPENTKNAVEENRPQAESLKQKIEELQKELQQEQKENQQEQQNQQQQQNQQEQQNQQQQEQQNQI